jgi:hypothetical protein
LILVQLGGVRWGSNNYHYDHPLFAESISNRLGAATDSSERDHLVKDWENVMIHELDPLRRHVKNTSFGDGELYGDLQLEFNMWVGYLPILNCLMSIACLGNGRLQFDEIHVLQL